MTKHSVLFVCLGNICRSPMAEAIFDDLAKKKGIREEWTIDSAGTGGHEAGNSIYGSAQKELKKHNIQYKHIARQITKEDYLNFEYILAFDKENISNIQRMKPKNSTATIELLGHYNENDKDQDIEDPWWNDTPAVFAKCYKDCYDSSQGFIKNF